MEQIKTPMRQNTCLPPSAVSPPRSRLLTIDRTHATLQLLGYIEKTAFLATVSSHGVISLIDNAGFVISTFLISGISFQPMQRLLSSRVFRTIASSQS